MYLADPHDGKGLLAEAETGPSGRYSMRTYHSGRAVLYTVDFKGPGHRSATKMKSMAIDHDTPAYEVDFEMEGAGFAIVVTDGVTGRPLSEAKADLRLEFRDGTASQSVMEADADGRLSLSGFPAGTARVNVKAKGYRGRDLVLPLEGEGGETPVALMPTRGIAGRVVTLEGQPIPGAKVLCGFPTEYGSQPLYEAVTDAVGAFRFDTIPEQPGTFFIAATGYALGVANLTPAEERTVVLTRPDSGTLILRGESGVPVSGYEVKAGTAGGAVIPRGAVSLLAEANGMKPSQLARTSSEGVLVLPQFLAPGSYQLYLSSGGGLSGIGSVVVPMGGTRVLSIPSNVLPRETR